MVLTATATAEAERRVSTPEFWEALQDAVAHSGRTLKHESQALGQQRLYIATIRLKKVQCPRRREVLEAMAERYGWPVEWVEHWWTVARLQRYSRRRSPRRTFACVGYEDHGVSRHARTCKGTLQLTPGGTNRLRSAGHGVGTAWGTGALRLPNPQPKFVDVQAGTYRCGPCTFGARSIALTETRIRGVTRERIRSRRQRREVMADTIHELNPGFLPSQQEASRRAAAQLASTGVLAHVSLARTRGLLVRAWSTSPLPKSLSVCRGCGLLTFPARSNRMGDWHQACWYEALRLYWPRPPAPSRSRGAPKRPAALRRHFSWTVRYYLGGEPMRQIARAESNTLKTVQEGIARIVALLPEPERVPKRFRLRVRLLCDAAAN